MKQKLYFLIGFFIIQIASFAQQATHLNFDGFNDDIVLPANIGNALSNGTELTIEYWFKGTNIQSAVRIQNGSGWIVAGWGDPNSPLFLVSTDGGVNGVSCGSIANDNTWHHLAFVWKKNDIFATYLDGVLQNSRVAANVNLPVFSGVTGRIGSFNSGSEFMNGNIDEVRIWNVAKTATQINASKNCELQGNETGLLAYYKFNQGLNAANNSGVTTLTDATSNGNNGTLSSNFALTGATSNWLAGSPVTTLTSFISSQTNIACNGGSNGAATVSVSGGTAPYTYAWSNGATTATINGLSAGTYTCTITDANGCTSNTISVTITQPTTLNSIISSLTNIACNGGADGSATVSVSGGTAPYTYAWSNGATTATINGVSAGTYICIITDANGCTNTRSATIMQPSALVATAIVNQNASCNGGADGIATVSVSGGYTPYTYAWSTGGNTATIYGLSAGTYTCTITDAAGCTNNTISVTITQQTLNSSISSQTNIACNGGINGAATVSVSAGTAPYTFSWSNGANTATINGLSAGTYTCTITDANSCSGTVSVTITEPSALVATAIVNQNASCNGDNYGVATVSLSGGTPPYSILWSNGATTATAPYLTAGTYTCTITDANGCSDTASVTISEPSALVATAIVNQNASCNGGADGAATVSVSGGTPPYSILWSNGAITATAPNLTAGAYTCTITDANFCTNNAISVTITEPSVLDDTISENIVGILIANQTSATYQWYQCPNTLLSGETNQNFTPSATGDYKVFITVGSCTKESSCYTVSTLGTENFEKDVVIVYPNPSNGIFTIDTKEAVTLEVYDMIGKKVFNSKIALGSSNLDLSNHANGIYLLIVTTENGATKSYKLIKQ